MKGKFSYGSPGVIYFVTVRSGKCSQRLVVIAWGQQKARRKDSEKQSITQVHCAALGEVAMGHKASRAEAIFERHNKHRGVFAPSLLRAVSFVVQILRCTAHSWVCGRQGIHDWTADLSCILPLTCYFLGLIFFIKNHFELNICIILSVWGWLLMSLKKPTLHLMNF